MLQNREAGVVAALEVKDSWGQLAGGVGEPGADLGLIAAQRWTSQSAG